MRYAAHILHIRALRVGSLVHLRLPELLTEWKYETMSNWH